MQKRTVILVDARNYVARHAYTHQGLSVKRNGKVFPTGMLYGAISGMMRLSRLHPNAAIVFVWDGEESNKSWRHELSPAYKAHRVHKDVDPKPEVKYMWQQIPVFENFLKVLGFRQLKVKSVEADDLIGILAYHVRTMVDKVIIYSMDRDFLQFVSTEIDVVADLDKTRQCRPISVKELKKKYEILPSQWLKYRALVGDKGDGIAGIPGIGPKTAVALLSSGVDATKPRCEVKNTKHKKVEYVKKNWSQVRLNYKLSRILRTADSKVFLPRTQKECIRLLKQIKAFEDLFRLEGGKGHATYKWMLQWLADLEMTDLMERRMELWRLL